MRQAYACVYACVTKLNELLNTTPTVVDINSDEEIMIVKETNKVKSSQTFSETEEALSNEVYERVVLQIKANDLINKTDYCQTLEPENSKDRNDYSNFEEAFIKEDIRRIESDFLDFKMFVTAEISSMKNYSHTDFETNFLREENKNLKKEVQELRNMVVDLVDNFNYKRQNQPTGTEKNNHQESWQKTRNSSTLKTVKLNTKEPLTLQNRYSLLSDNEPQNYNYNDNNDLNSDDDHTEEVDRRNITQRRRPNVVINNYPERENLLSKKKAYTDQRSKNEAGKISNKKITIFGDSIPKMLQMKEFNRHVTAGKAYLKSFPGATARHLGHYTIPTMMEHKPDTVIIHVGINDVLKARNENELDVNKVAKDIINVGLECSKHGVQHVFISSIVRNKNHKKQDLIYQINKIVQEKCKIENFGYIDNENIETWNLWKDGTHLVESGRVRLAKTFLYNVNFLDQPPSINHWI